jgi:hypothetical protein
MTMMMTTGAPGRTKSHSTLIGRQWRKVLPSVWVFYVILEIGINEGFAPNFAGDCGFAQWTKYVRLIAATCFIFSSFHNLGMMAFLGLSMRQQKDTENPTSIYAASGTVSLIAGISEILTLTVGSERIFCDALGVETYISQWAAWMVTVPLLGYITIGIEDKMKISREDWLYILSLFLMPFFGFILIFGGDGKEALVNGWTIFLLGCVSYAGNIVMAMKSRRRALMALRSQTRDGFDLKVERTLTKYRLTVLLLVFLPMFPLMYLLRYYNVIDR